MKMLIFKINPVGTNNNITPYRIFDPQQQQQQQITGFFQPPPQQSFAPAQQQPPPVDINSTVFLPDMNSSVGADASSTATVDNSVYFGQPMAPLYANNINYMSDSGLINNNNNNQYKASRNNQLVTKNLNLMKKFKSKSVKAATKNAKTATDVTTGADLAPAPLKKKNPSTSSASVSSDADYYSMGNLNDNSLTKEDEDSPRGSTSSNVMDDSSSSPLNETPPPVSIDDGQVLWSHVLKKTAAQQELETSQTAAAAGVGNKTPSRAKSVSFHENSRKGKFKSNQTGALLRQQSHSNNRRGRSSQMVSDDSNYHSKAASSMSMSGDDLFASSDSPAELMEHQHYQGSGGGGQEPRPQSLENNSRKLYSDMFKKK
jgi:hypothetical protein